MSSKKDSRLKCTTSQKVCENVTERYMREKWWYGGMVSPKCTRNKCTEEMYTHIIILTLLSLSSSSKVTRKKCSWDEQDEMFYTLEKRTKF
jgi:hypothetical protein